MTESLRTQLLLKNIYQEASPEKLKYSQKLITSKPEMRDEYLDLLQMVSDMPAVKFSPSDSTIQSLLGYSQSFQAAGM